MPVVVVGASGLVGRRAVEAFARISPEVRAFVRRKEAGPGLRALGAKVAVGWIGDVDTLATVMAGAHTVCHLVGGLDSSHLEDDILGTLGPVLVAASRARVERVLYLSYPGASSRASNPYLRFKGLAEEAIAESGLEHAIIRATHVYGPESRWLTAMVRSARRWPSMVIGSGHQVMAPVFVLDVAAALAGADDRGALRSGTWGLEGPDRLTADELADLLAARHRAKLHLRPGLAARLARLAGLPRRTASQMPRMPPRSSGPPEPG